MKRSLFVVAVLLIPTVAAAQDWWEDEFEEYPPITLELNAWLADISGTVRWGSGTIPGTDIDFQNDLGLDSTEVGPLVRLDIGITDMWDIRFSFWHTNFDNTLPLETTVDFGGTLFAPGTEVDVEFMMDAYTALLGYKFVDGEQLDLTFLFGAGIYRPQLTIEDDAGPTQREATIPTPLVGVALDLELSESLSLRGQVAGMSLDISDGSGQVLDAEAAIRLQLFEGICLIGGYKLFTTDAEFMTEIEDEYNMGNFRIEGPFFGLGLIF